MTVQTTPARHPASRPVKNPLAAHSHGTTTVARTRLGGGTASGRVYICELIRLRDGSSHVNYAICHDRYQHTPDGWKFTERAYEIRYLGTTSLADSAPQAARAAR
jgi:SnoaL-like domain